MPRVRRGIDPLRIPIYDPFLQTVPPPTSDPDDPALICIQVNEQYRKYLIGAVWSLCYEDRFAAGEGAKQIAVQRMHELIALISEAAYCDDICPPAGGGAPLSVGDLVWTVAAQCPPERLEMGSTGHVSADYPELTPILEALGWMNPGDPTFDLPDASDSYISHDPAQLGNQVGVNSHALTKAELPNHQHWHNPVHGTYPYPDLPGQFTFIGLTTAFDQEWGEELGPQFTGNISPRAEEPAAPEPDEIDLRSKRLYARLCIVAKSAGGTTVPDPCCDQPAKPDIITIYNTINTEINNYGSYDPNEPTTVDPGLDFDSLDPETRYDLEDVLCFALWLWFEAYRLQHNQMMADLQDDGEMSNFDKAQWALALTASLLELIPVVTSITIAPWIAPAMWVTSTGLELVEWIVDNDDPQTVEALPEQWTDSMVCLVWNNLRGTNVTFDDWQNALSVELTEPVFGGWLNVLVAITTRYFWRAFASEDVYAGFLTTLAEVKKTLPVGAYKCPCCPAQTNTGVGTWQIYTPGSHPAYFQEESEFIDSDPDFWVFGDGTITMLRPERVSVSQVRVTYRTRAGNEFEQFKLRLTVGCWTSVDEFQNPIGAITRLYNISNQDLRTLSIERLNANRTDIISIEWFEHAP